jgi:glutaminyl-peptide cyclotransferase
MQPVDPNHEVVGSDKNPNSKGVSLVAVNGAIVDPGLDAKRAFAYLEKICAIGSRTTGTEGMIQQQQMLRDHFENLGGTILWQPFEVRHPETGAKVEVRNMVVQWKPDKTERVLICTHYDTKPFPANDPRNPKGLFVGANDGGSGTALLMELGHVMLDLPTNVGVDFIFFDAEELIYVEGRDEFFLGSKYFARGYVNDTSSARYRCGILLDMIGDADLQLYYEENSFKYAKPLVEEVWGIAKQLHIKEFEPKVIHFVSDDHIPLNEIAHIPVIDIIDFDYPRGVPKKKGYWHTMADRPDKCSGASLVKVGSVLLEWMKRQK